MCSYVIVGAGSGGFGYMGNYWGSVLGFFDWGLVGMVCASDIT